MPMVLGQVLRLTPVLPFQARHKKSAKRISECILLSIVWNSFSNAFTSGTSLTLGTAGTLGVVTAGLHLAYFFFALVALPATRSKRVASAYVSSHKTLAFGLPLIRSVFDGHPDLAYYVAPLMIVHPLQLFLGGVMAGGLRGWIKEEGKKK